MAEVSTTPWTLFIILCTLLPAVSACASYAGFSQLSLWVFLAIALSFFVVALRKSASDNSLMWLVFCFSLSLIFSSTFLSSNLPGGNDIVEEYRLFLQISQTHHWVSPPFAQVTGSLYGSVISITVLPTVIATVTGLAGLTVFTIVIPLLYSITPVILYKIYRTILSPRDAFLSAIMFMSYPVFYTTLLGVAREMIAQVLLVILIALMLSSRASALASIILTFGLVISHYSLAFVYIGIVMFSFLIGRITRSRIETPIRSAMLAVVATIAWFAFVGGGATLVTLTQAMSRVLSGIGSNFFGGPRPTEVMAAIGAVQGQQGILHTVNKATQYVVQIFLVLGFAVLAFKRRKTLGERRILPLMTFAMAFLVASVALPFLAATLNLPRIYNISLLFLAPCLVIGVESLEQFRKLKTFQYPFTWRLRFHFPTKQVVVAVILCSYLLFTSGWAWSVSMDRIPTSPIFDSSRMRNSTDITLKSEYFTVFITTPDIAAARWISQHQRPDHVICSDVVAQDDVLTAYGEYPSGGSGTVLPYCNPNSYVYLGEFNTAYGYYRYATAQQAIVTPGSRYQIPEMLTPYDRIFSGDAAIYCGVTE